MRTSDGFYPVYLYYKDLEVLILSFGESETVKQTDRWNFKAKDKSFHRTEWSNNIREKNPTIKDFLQSDKVYRYGDSFVFKAYRVKTAYKDDDDYNEDGSFKENQRYFKEFLYMTSYNENKELEESRRI